MKITIWALQEWQEQRELPHQGVSQLPSMSETDVTYFYELFYDQDDTNDKNVMRSIE